MGGPMSDGVIWRPTDEVKDQSQLARFWREHGLSSYDELRARSLSDPDWFWDAIANDVGIRWLKPYETVRDLSSGKPWTDWFTGGAVNIVDSAIDRHAEGPAADKQALVWYPESG